MVQDQLVGYIKDQLKLGVSRDAVKTALTGAGWAVGDVEDTFKKIDAGATPAFGTMIQSGGGPERVFPTTVGGAKDAAAKGAGMKGDGVKSAEPRSIRVSDLISAGDSPAPASAPIKVDEKKIARASGPTRANGAASMAGAPSRGSHGGRNILVITGIAVLLALAGYLYFQNTGLASKVASLSTESAGVTAQIDTLNGNITALDASNTALAAQVGSLTAENADLLANLSFVAVPPASSAETATGTPAEESATMSGMLTKPKTTYVLTTQYGVMVYVKNSADAAVAAALKPLAGSTSTVTLAGTHVSGSAYLTVTSVNGSAVQSQSQAPTSTTQNQ